MQDQEQDDLKESSESSSSTKSSRDFEENYSKIDSSNLRYFDSNYDDKIIISDNTIMKHTDKNVYYRDVHQFIIRAKEMIITKEAQQVRDNL